LLLYFEFSSLFLFLAIALAGFALVTKLIIKD
jgi:hypothetical protein